MPRYDHTLVRMLTETCQADLSASEKLILLVLANQHGLNGGGGPVKGVTVGKLATLCSLHPSTARRNLIALEVKGYIDVKHTGRAHEITVMFPGGEVVW